MTRRAVVWQTVVRRFPAFAFGWCLGGALFGNGRWIFVAFSFALFVASVVLAVLAAEPTPSAVNESSTADNR